MVCESLGLQGGGQVQQCLFGWNRQRDGVRTRLYGPTFSSCVYNLCHGNSDGEVATDNNLVPEGHALTALNVKLVKSWGQYAHRVDRRQGIHYGEPMTDTSDSARKLAKELEALQEDPQAAIDSLAQKIASLQELANSRPDPPRVTNLKITTDMKKAIRVTAECAVRACMLTDGKLTHEQQGFIDGVVRRVVIAGVPLDTRIE